MREIIAALQVSVDGFIEGPKGELDWVDTWEDPFDLMSRVDTCILGGRMYPGYEQYWRAILADPRAVLPFTGRIATKGEIEYAHFAVRTAHVVLSTTLEWTDWSATRIVRHIDEIRVMKEQPGQDMYAVGGAQLVSSLMGARLVDELRLVVRPVVLGGGKALFNGFRERRDLALVDATPLQGDMVRLTYRAAA